MKILDKYEMLGQRALAYFKKHYILISSGFILLTLYIFCLPSSLFKDPVSTVILDKNGDLLGAKIASDGQWRFPEVKHLPEKYVKAVTTYEDKRFFYHPGVDPVSFMRAIIQNFRAGKYISGGSTLTMQTIRLSRKNQNRTILEKCIEIILATRLEIRYSKSEILNLYASYAPFGGNVVGFETATWRFFGKKTRDLSWAESCMLAVLPNNPGSIFPGKNRLYLKAKRNRLLKKLFLFNIIDKTTYSLSVEEELPEAPTPLPRYAPHLLEKLLKDKNTNPANDQILTTIDLRLQKKMNDIAERHLEQLKVNDIHNLAILIIDNQNNEVVSYIGNAPGTGPDHNEQVDIIQSSRSTGSLLKPLLYAKAMDRGIILPKSYLPDIPIQFGGYKPENFRLTFDGALPVNHALVKSLNIPFVKLLENYGIQIFHNDLKKFGFTDLNPSPSHYGLTMVVGGIENSLWNICKAYSGMAKTLADYRILNGRYSNSSFADPACIKQKREQRLPVSRQAPVVKAASVWHTFQAMQSLERPAESGEWEQFVSSKKIAWKTGTSFGYRDAWSVGISPKYTVGVWTGNADGEGRPNLIGIYTAAPIMFEIFDELGDGKWFDEPFDEEIRIPVCSISGYRASALCPADSMWVPSAGMSSDICSYHKKIYTNKQYTLRVNLDCEKSENIISENWFVLDPIQEHYFKLRNAWYKPLPPYKEGCYPELKGKDVMNMIYPKDQTTVYIPRQLSGKRESVVFQAAHHLSGTNINWFVDDEYITTTSDIHKIDVTPAFGDHILTLVDNNGYRLVIRFTIRESADEKL